MSFFRQQLTQIATHILRCNGKWSQVVCDVGDWGYVLMFRFHLCLNCCPFAFACCFCKFGTVQEWMNDYFLICILFYCCLSHPDDAFGPRLLQLCNQALFECLALNLHCLRGDQGALTAVINHRIVSALSLIHVPFPSFVSQPGVCSKWNCQIRCSEKMPAHSQSVMLHSGHIGRETKFTTRESEDMRWFFMACQHTFPY